MLARHLSQHVGFWLGGGDTVQPPFRIEHLNEMSVITARGKICEDDGMLSANVIATEVPSC